MKRILISGGNSIVGTHLRSLLSKQTEIITLGRTGCDIACDLATNATVASLPRLDAVIHTAAQFGGESDAEFFETVAVNVLGTIKICQMAVAARASQVIIISSAFANLPSSSAHFTVYSLSKRQGDEAALLYCTKHAMPLTVLRPSQLYGDDDRFRRHQPFFYQIIDKAQAGKDIVFFGKHDARRNFLHIDDLCESIERVISQLVTGTFVCMHPKNVTYSEIARYAIGVFKSSSKIRFDPHQADIPDNTLPAENTLFEQLRWHPKVSLADGIARIAALRMREIK